jgi:ribonuclease BN (tRNA processing enzyme)
MRLTVLGGCGAWPAEGQACSGYLLESGGFRLLVDPGYATLPRLLAHCRADEVDAVFVTHGHPDHCADLNPLLRARALAGEPAPPVPVYAPPGSLDAVVALDDMRAMHGALTPIHLRDGDRVHCGPFSLQVAELPHFVTNLAVRVDDASSALAYSGDGGPDRALAELASGADLLLVEATYPESVPEPDRGLLNDVPTALAQARQAGARRTLVTHWWPSTARGRYTRQLATAPDLDAELAVPGATMQLPQLGTATAGRPPPPT